MASVDLYQFTYLPNGFFYFPRVFTKILKPVYSHLRGLGPALQSNSSIILTTDASTLGWGAALENVRAGGSWDQTEQQYHINWLEMKAVLLGLRSLCKLVSKHVSRVQCDNTTAIAYIIAMAGMKSKECDNLAKQIWDYCIARNIWISACHIPGSQNFEADTESRVLKLSTGWSLSLPVFVDIASRWEVLI